jgi:DNA polymerase III epsilon subunit-like protein
MQDKSQTENIYTSRQLPLAFPEKPSVEAEKDNNRRPNHYIFVDLETGGLYADKHAVLQVAAIITDFDFNIKGNFMSYVQPHPTLKITDEALQINQLRREDLQNAPDEKSVALALRHFARLVSGAPRFAGYNCPFDLEFLTFVWKRHDLLPVPYQVPWLDICSLARLRLESSATLPNFKLASVANYFGLNIQGAHDAVADLIMTIEIAKRLKSMPEKSITAKTKNGIDLETVKFSVPTN